VDARKPRKHRAHRIAIAKPALSAAQAEQLRRIPSVDELLSRPRLAAFANRINRDLLVALLRDLKDDFVKIEFDQEGGESLVFPHAKMDAATEELLTDNGVRAQGSADTLAVWQAAKAPPAAQAR